MHKKIDLDAKKCGFALVTILMAVFLILLGPADYFTHSNVAAIDFPEIDWIPQEEYGEDILLGQGESFSVEFVPGQRHFAGFYIYLGTQDTMQGQLVFTVSDASGKMLGTDKFLLEDLKLPGWKKITIKSNISPGGGYTLTISNRDSSAPVKLLTVDDIYIPEETVSGNIPLRYVYNVPTFTLQEKILLSLIVVALWLLYVAEVVPSRKQFIKKSAVCLLLAAILAWNGLYGSIDHNNIAFDSYQKDSEALVLGAIDAHRAGIYLEQPGYSLGFYKPGEDDVSAGIFRPYRSQYGLQGAAFTFLSKFIGIETMHLLCSLCFASVAILIVVLIDIQYDRLLAGVFYVVFLLSPWTTNFARNLYWVEFTWFIPMAVGLFCAWKINSQKCRILCYAAAFLSLLAKSLCGYEYVSTVMMGLIQFLLADLLFALTQRERKKSGVLFRTILGLGIAAITGFAVAIMIHAYLKGDGSLFRGLESIFKDDVLRRTNGGDPLNFADGYADSLDCSVWSVLCTYFKMDTQILTGINGNLFPLLCIVPLAIFYAEYQQKKLNTQDAFLYLITFLAPVSWYVLAKAHSYVHTEMNEVLWYFGFVQICLYIIVKKSIDRLSGAAALPCAPGDLPETDYKKSLTSPRTS